MRCSLKFDENKLLQEQPVAAWGEMQSLSEEPSYREDEIKSQSGKDILLGYKSCVDDVRAMIDDLHEHGEMSEYAWDYLSSCMVADIAMQLFAILDDEVEL